MLEIHKIKIGTRIELGQEPYEVIKTSFSKIGRQGAVLRTKLKNLKTGSVSEQTFRDADKLEEPELAKKKAQFLYAENDVYNFMDQESYEQFSLNQETLGDLAHFLIEGCDVELIYFNEEPINIELPIKLKFKVVDAPPSIKGNTADGGTKKVKIETGYELNVPLFIEKGDVILINTQEGTYVSRES